MTAAPKVIDTDEVVVAGDEPEDLEIEISDEPEAAEPDQIPDNLSGTEEEDEISGYSERVQKRIKQLKREFHDERRAKEDATRLQEEAVRYAQNVGQDNVRLKSVLNEGEKTLLHQADARMGAELEKARQDWRTAFNSGNEDDLLEAQENIAKVTAEKSRFEALQLGAPGIQPAQPAQQPAQQMPPQVPKPDSKAVDWMEKNPWYQKDHLMTSLAMAKHHEIVLDGAVPVNSDEYYRRIDSELRLRFPEKFGGGNAGRNPRAKGTVVAPATRSGKTPRRVTLTSTQVSLAKRLGLTPEQYAEQIVKELQEDD